MGKEFHAKVCNRCSNVFRTYPEKKIRRLARKSEREPRVCVVCGCPMSNKIKQEEIHFK